MTSRRLIIADDLRRQITTGRIGPGDRLPSESALADRYKVSTATLRSALAVLQGEGLVEKIHGKGNFVRRTKRKITYVGGWGTLDPRTATDVDLRVTVRTTALPARGHLTALLKVDDGSPLTEFLRLSYEESPPQSGPRLRTARPGTDHGAQRPAFTGVGGGQFLRVGPAAGRDPRDGVRPAPHPG